MKLLRKAEVAELLDVHTGTVDKLNLPGAVRVGCRTKYREDAILDFITNGGCHPVSGPGLSPNNPTPQMSA